MIVEVRNYRVTAGRRGDFVRFFESDVVPALRSYGMKVVGPLLDVENPNRFTWLRAFPSIEERERMLEAFYGGPKWKDELEKVAMPMLESYDFSICETVPGMAFDELQVDLR